MRDSFAWWENYLADCNALVISLSSTLFHCDVREWGERRGSNPRQPAPQAGALPTELLPPLICIMQSGQASDNTIHIYIFDIIVCEYSGLDQPWFNSGIGLSINQKFHNYGKYSIKWGHWQIFPNEPKDWAEFLPACNRFTAASLY